MKILNFFRIHSNINYFSNITKVIKPCGSVLEHFLKIKQYFIVILYILFCLSMTSCLRNNDYQTKSIDNNSKQITIPLRIECHDDSDSRSSLDIVRQLDGSFTAFMNKEMIPPKMQVAVVTPNLSYKLDKNDNIILTSRQFKISISKIYSVGISNIKFNNLFSCENKRLRCSIANRVESAPKVDSILKVVGSIFDDKEKVFRKVEHNLKVDLITRNSSDEDVILSLSNYVRIDEMPLNAPVYNGQKIVGFVKSYNPKNFLSTEIVSIDDPTTRKKLGWPLNPIRLQPSDPSERLKEAFCDRDPQSENSVYAIVSANWPKCTEKRTRKPVNEFPGWVSYN
jgi:hypothetical protein